MFWDVFRQVLRGESDKPFTVYLELIHFTLPPLLKAMPPEEPARQKLLNVYFSKDTKATAVHLKTLLNAYLAARQAIVQRSHLQFQANTRFESEIKRIVENKA
jgi:hypothetical protein